MVTDRVGSTLDGGLASTGLDDLCASLLNSLDELTIKPFCISLEGIPQRSSSELSMERVWELGGRMVTPDGHLGDIRDSHWLA